jgi:hypothetical protein
MITFKSLDNHFVTFVITYFWVIPQIHIFSLFKKYKKIKIVSKKYNNEKWMSEHSKNGQKLVEEVKKFKD